MAGWGLALPEQVCTNADLAARLDTTDEWIHTRTGIRERRVAGAGEDSATLGAAAGAQALKRAGLVPDEIDLVVVATMTPPQAMPGTAVLVQELLGVRGAAFDLNAACSGFVYALVTAALLITGGAHQRALVIGVDVMTRVVDPDDRATAVLFGDGAAATVLVGTDDPADGGLLSWDLDGDPSGADLLCIPPGERFLQMEGREVFRRAVRALVESSSVTLDRAGVTAAEVDLFIPHQANSRIIDATAARLGIGPARTAVNVDRYGNTSAASVPLVLAEAADAGRLLPGDLVLLAGVGAGMGWATALLRWGEVEAGDAP